VSITSKTKYPELFAALAAPFDPKEVKVLPKGKMQIQYVTARTVMNRLDTVLGPENWYERFRGAGENSVLCLLTIILPDGRKLTKCDAGGNAGMSDAGDDDKSGHSDAFKRAAVKLGVGRYLYKDGVPDYRMPAHETGKAPDRTWNDYARRVVSQANEFWQAAQAEAGVSPEHRRELLNVYQLANALVKRALAADPPLLTQSELDSYMTPGGSHNTTARRAAEDLYRRDPSRVMAFVEKYIKSELGAARQAFADSQAVGSMPREPGSDG
jgi:hypothetical protein